MKKLLSKLFGSKTEPKKALNVSVEGKKIEKPPTRTERLEKLVGTMYTGIAAWVKGRGEKADKAFSRELNTALVEIKGYSEEKDSYFVAVKLKRAGGRINTYAKYVKVKVFKQKLAQGSLEPCDDDVFLALTNLLLKKAAPKSEPEEVISTTQGPVTTSGEHLEGTEPPKKAQRVAKITLKEFKDGYADAKRRQPGNQGIGVEVRFEEGDEEKTREIRGASEIDAFIARCDKGEVRLLEMIR